MPGTSQMPHASTGRARAPGAGPVRRGWVLAAVAALGVSHAAGATGATSGTFFGPGGAVAIGTFTVPPTIKCPNSMPEAYAYPDPASYEAALEVWDDCEAKREELVTSLILGGFPLGKRQLAPARSPAGPLPPVAQRPRMKAALPNAAPTLGASTPELPFLGNPLVVVGSVPDAADPASVTAAYSVLLRRQSDCSLVEDLVWPNAASPNTPAATLITSLPAAQDNFHRLAGLKTLPDVFAQGCNYASYGQASSSNTLLLGTSASGAVISASLTGTGVTVSLTDVTANTFTSRLAIPSSTISAIAAADVNGDGIVDLVAAFITDPATQLPGTAVFLGNGDGTFKAGVYYDVPGDVTIDDVNGDGRPDIVICGATPGITTLLGKGDGSFTPGALSATGLRPCFGAAGAVITADFNGDGRKDLLVQGTVALGNGDGTFTMGLPVTADTAFNFSSGIAAVAAADVNKDGRVDVVVSQPGFVALFYGRGDGSFAAGPRYAALPDYLPVSIVDVDGDGNPDVILGAASGGIYASGCCGESLVPPMSQLLMGRGDGTFVDSTYYAVGRYASGPQIAAADFNGDGKIDVLTVGPGGGGQANTIVMLPGDGTGLLGAAVASAVNFAPGLVVTADMNGDGKPDAVIAGGSGVAVLLNQGNGTFAAEQDYPLPSSAVSLVTGDFNGDGKPDVAVGVYPGPGAAGASGVYVLWGQANGILAAPVKIDSSFYPDGLAAADLNGDGRTDLVVADQGFFSYVGGSRQINGALHVYLGNAAGTFAAVAAPATPATNYSVVALGDVSGDGKVDLLVAGTVAGASPGAAGKPALYTFLGVGDGTFKAAGSTALVGNYGIGSTSIALSDLNHDGHADIVLGDSTAFTSVLLGKGNGLWVASLLALGQQPLALTAADLSGDGFPELLVGTLDATGSAGLEVFLNVDTWTSGTVLTPTTTTLTSSAPSAPAGQPLTLTATVSAAAGTAPPAGTVTFEDGAIALGTATMSAGTATSTFTLAAGSHNLTASYGGSTAFAASTSGILTVTVAAAAPDFTLSLSPAAAAAAAGQSLTTNITVTPTGGFAQAVSLSCTGLPAGVTCSLSPSSVTPAGGPVISKMTIATAARVALGSPVRPFDPGVPGGILVGSIGAPLAVRSRRRRHSVRGALLLLGLVSVCSLQGCHHDGPAGSGAAAGTPAGTYAVTITAAAGSVTHSTSFALTVQ